MAISAAISFRTRDKLNVGAQTFDIHRLEISGKAQRGSAWRRCPFRCGFCWKICCAMRTADSCARMTFKALALWKPGCAEKEIAFMPARVLLQDFTGVPAVVDLAAMREAVKKMGGNPKRINPLFPAELVIDHSVQVDNFGT